MNNRSECEPASPRTKAPPMTQIVQEGIEPLLVGEKLLQKIQYKPGMTTVFPAIEPLRADMAGDGMDLPIYNINIGGAQSFGVQVQRHGLLAV